MTLRQVRNYIIAVGVITIAMIGNLFYTTNSLRNAVGVVRDLTTLQEVVLSIDQIEAAMEEERIAIGQYQLTGDQELLTRIEDAQATYDTNWAVLLDKRGQEQAELLADIEESRNVYVGLLNQVIDAYLFNPNDNESSARLSEAITYFLQNLDPKFSRFAEPEIRSYTEQREVKELLAVNLENIMNIASVAGAVMSVVAIIMSALTVYNTQRIVNAIEGIVKASNAISRGDLERPIEAIQGGEIGDLTQAVERMRTSLKAAIERLRR